MTTVKATPTTTETTKAAINPRVNYVDKAEFLARITEYRKDCRAAKKAKKPKPKIPEYLARCIMLIAENAAKHPHYSRYSFKDIMISDAVENCLTGRMKVITEDGEKPIKWVVNNRYRGRVLSLTKDGFWQWNRVISHSKMRNETKSWVVIRTQSQIPKAFECTPDHLCSFIENPLRPTLNYLPAKKMCNKWIVRNYRPNHNRHERRLYNEEQTSALIGIMMGDGYINKEGQVLIPHCEAQREYNLSTQTLLGGAIRNRIQTHGYGKGNEYNRLTVPPNGQTKHLRQIMYDDNGGRKSIKNILPYINEITLAYWYMDDGYINYQNDDNPHAVFCTDGFSDEDVLKLKALLESKWGLKSTIVRVNPKKQCRLRLWQDSSLKFFNIIAKYVQPCLLYKLPESHRDAVLKHLNNKPLDYVISKVHSVTKPTYRISSYSYDIGVENAHNFVANQTLVHNCIRYFDNFDPRHAKKNPFGYFSTCCIYAFWRRIGLEKEELYGKYKLAQQSGVMDELHNGMEDNGSGDGSIQKSEIFDNLNTFIAKYEEGLAKKKEKKALKKAEKKRIAKGLEKFAKKPTKPRNKK